MFITLPFIPPQMRHNVKGDGVTLTVTVSAVYKSKEQKINCSLNPLQWVLGHNWSKLRGMSLCAL